MIQATSQNRSMTDIPTEYASRYLQQLCKHFSHKRPVSFDEHSGQITLMAGECRLTADDAKLTVVVEAQDPSQLEQLQDVIVRHLVRFAFREELSIDWRPA